MGCTDSRALNYKAFFVVDDQTCEIGGCTDSRLPEYDAAATWDDMSCMAVPGCMDSAAYNYRQMANVAGGVCLYQGCLNPSASNYDPSATLPGHCISIIYGCMDPTASNYYAQANREGFCLYIGCTDSTRPNYNPSAMFDDGLCESWFDGCTDSRASNYDPLFNRDDGQCNIAGCLAKDPDATFNVPCLCNGDCSVTRRRRLGGADECWDPAALNYHSGATSGADCVYTVTGCTDSAASNYLPIANEDDGGCIFPVYGCTVANGTLNYDSTATVLHGCENERTGAYTLGLGLGLGLGLA